MGEVYSDFVPSFITQTVKRADDDTNNGLYLNGVYMPEEVIIHILSFIDPKELLSKSLVCHKWNGLIKSSTLWTTIYTRKYNKKPKKLPWYVYCCLLSTNYFSDNLLKNGNGQEKFIHWDIKANDGDEFIIENPPLGADPLPADVPEFYNHKSCFATSFGKCCKAQVIPIEKSKLFKYILQNYKPHIYLSEWTAGRFDCGCVFKLQCGFKFKNRRTQGTYPEPHGIHRVEQWKGKEWKKIEITITDYPADVEEIIYEHEGQDTQFWKGHYGSKFAGGVFRFLFDSIEPRAADEKADLATTSTEFSYTTNGEKFNGHMMSLEMWPRHYHDYYDVEESESESDYED